MCEPTPSSSVVLPPVLSSTRVARRFVEDHWCSVHDSADPRMVHLLITELVSNAVRHGGPPIAVAIDCVEVQGVRVSVSDGSDEDPVLKEVGLDGEGGRGVRLVDLLSVEWGVEHGGAVGTRGPAHAAEPHGKTVWCRLVGVS